MSAQPSTEPDAGGAEFRAITALKGFTARWQDVALKDGAFHYEAGTCKYFFKFYFIIFTVGRTPNMTSTLNKCLSVP